MLIFLVLNILNISSICPKPPSINTRGFALVLLPLALSLLLHMMPWLLIIFVYSSFYISLFSVVSASVLFIFLNKY